MSEGDITLTLEKREVLGKAVKSLRRTGQVPAVIHDHGKESVHVQAPLLELLKTYQHAGKHHPVNLKLGGQNYLALIKDVDFEPKKHQLRHVVFNAVRQDEKVEAEVPIHLEGEIPAEKAGLMIITTTDVVTVEALPKDLPDALTVDASSLAEIGDKVTVADIKVPQGVEITSDAELVIAGVEETKEQISEEATEEEAAEGEAESAAAEAKAEGTESSEEE